MPLVKSDNIYFEDRKVNKMYLNGALIYHNMFALNFDINITEVEMEYTGGTFIVEITANKPWSLTFPEWISASTVSGKSSETITFTVGKNSGDTERVGNISVTCNNIIKQINVTQNYQKTIIDYSKEYLTFIVTSGGTIVWRKAGSNAQNLSISYSINNGTWATITASSTEGTAINVVAGDKVRFKGTNSSYAKSASYVTACRFAGTATCCVCGNIMSLIYGDNFIGQNTLQSANAFCGLFFSYSKMTSDGEHKLVLPATTLTNDCYHHMFYGCSNLTTAPELPATTLKSLCYAEMFGGCSKLNYIKCLATNISADRCTNYWLNGVSSTGTFIKASSMTSWETGASGIPTGWTVVNNS